MRKRMWKYPHLYTACKYTTGLHNCVFLFQKIRCIWSCVLEEREFTFCVNIKLAPVAVKWAGMPIQLPKLCLSNRNKYQMISPFNRIGKHWDYFNLLVNHKQGFFYTASERPSFTIVKLTYHGSRLSQIAGITGQHFSSCEHWRNGGHCSCWKINFYKIHI